MKIRDLYLSSKRTTRLSIACLLIALGALVSFVNNINPLLTAGIGLGLLLFIEVFFSKPKFVWLTIIWAVTTIMLAGLALAVYLVFLEIYGQEQAIFGAGLIILAGLPSIILIGFFTWLTGYGSPILNLLTTQAIYLLTLSATFSSLSQQNLLLPLGISFVAGFIYPLLNWWLGRKIESKRNKKVSYTYPDTKLKTLLEQDIETNFKLSEKYDTNYIVGISDKNHYVILPLAGENVNSVTLEGNYLKVDSKDYTWVLDKVAQTAREYSKANKVPQRFVTPVVALPKLESGKQVTPIVVRSRFQPQKNLGTVLLLSKSKLNSLN